MYKIMGVFSISQNYSLTSQEPLTTQLFLVLRKVDWFFFLSSDDIEPS